MQDNSHDDNSANQMDFYPELSQSSFPEVGVGSVAEVRSRSSSSHAKNAWFTSTSDNQRSSANDESLTHYPFHALKDFAGPSSSEYNGYYGNGYHSVDQGFRPLSIGECQGCPVERSPTFGSAGASRKSETSWAQNPSQLDSSGVISSPSRSDSVAQVYRSSPLFGDQQISSRNLDLNWQPSDLQVLSGGGNWASSDQWNSQEPFLNNDLLFMGDNQNQSTHDAFNTQWMETINLNVGFDLLPDTILSSRTFDSAPQAIQARILCSFPPCNKTFKRDYERIRHETSLHGIGHGLHLCPIVGCVKSQGTGYSRADKVKEHLWKKHADLGYVKREM